MDETLSFDRLKEAAEMRNTALVIYRALEIFLNVQQRSLAAIAALESAYHDEDKLPALLTNLRQWCVALEARIDLAEAWQKGSPEQVMVLYQSKMQAQDCSEEIVLENMINSLRSAVVAIQAGVSLLRSTLRAEHTELGVLEQQMAIFSRTHQFLRAYARH